MDALKLFFLFLPIALMGCCVGISVHAASFDCMKAGSKVEHIICDDPEISKLDEKLSERYRISLRDKEHVVTVKNEQKQWIKERDVCTDEACVKNAYELRLDALVKQSEAKLAQGVQQTLAQHPFDKTACLAPKIDWRNYQWVMITGKGEAICEEMFAFLKSRPADEPPPTCPEERLPSNGNWTRPESSVLSEENRQAILRDMPEKYRHFPMGVSYERWISGSKLLRVIRGDITRDGIPESMLAYSSGKGLSLCESSKRCAQNTGLSMGSIDLDSDSYDLLPMKDAGTQVNWLHAAFEHRPVPPLLSNGELIYYQGRPYWLEGISWSQKLHDGFAHYSMRPWDVNSRMFSLVAVTYGSKQYPAKFEETWGYWPQILDPENEQYCRIGYFHRDNIKLNARRKGD